MASNGSVIEGMPEFSQQETEDSSNVKIDDITFNVDHKGLLLNLKGKFLTEQNAAFDFGTISLVLKLNKQALAEVKVTGLRISNEDRNFNVTLEVLPKIEGDTDSIKRALDAIGAGKLAGVTAGIKDITVRNYDDTAIPWLDEILGGIDVSFFYFYIDFVSILLIPPFHLFLLV